MKETISAAKRDNSIDKTLATINVTTLLGYIFIFQVSQLNSLVRYTLLLSLILFALSLPTLLWYLYRYPIRRSYWEKLKDRNTNKYADRIATFIENIVRPLASLKAKDEIAKRFAECKTVAEAQGLLKQLESEERKGSNGLPPEEEEAYRYVVEGFLTQVSLAVKEDYEKAFLKPLNEKHSRLKNQLDKLSFKLRRHLLASAGVVLLLAIIIDLLKR